MELSTVIFYGWLVMASIGFMLMFAATKAHSTEKENSRAGLGFMFVITPLLFMFILMYLLSPICDKIATRIGL